MPHDQIDPLAPLVRPASPYSRRLALIGLVAACGLGAWAGFWARPTAGEKLGEPRPVPAAAAGRTTAAPRLEIVVDDRPAPIGEPLEVLARPSPPVTAAPAPVPKAPDGLLRVAAIARTPADLIPPGAGDTPRPGKRPADQSPRPMIQRTSFSERPRTRAPAKPAVRRTRPAEVRTAPREETAEAGARARGPQRRAGQGHAPAHQQLATKEARPRRPEPTRIAQARADRPAARRREATPKVQVARSALARKAGPVRCASRDAGARLACADPDLAAADRRMARAYRQAEAAGVPAAELQRQHRRWLQARSAAAREAPWAVQDVYQQRIAELREQAGDGGY